MKRLYLLLCVLGPVVLLQIGCGRKGDPIVPVVPQPLPVQNVSASIDAHRITLSWEPPSMYDTGKPMPLKDIKTMTVFRKTETLTDNTWDFSQSNEGWTVAGRTFPVKWHKGMLRTASTQTSAFLVSPKNLALKAENIRYVRLKLWAKNSDRGYIAFVTEEDKNWDTGIDLMFQPAVHTSFYSYQNVFNTVKLKSFQIPPVGVELKENAAYEYTIDMQGVPSWKGQINQLGIIFRNSDPELAMMELGLDSVTFTGTLEGRASVYESSPWLFLEDEEGWTPHHPGTICEATGGVLYTRGAELIALTSAPGQNMKLDNIRQVQIRMKVTRGDTAYLVLRKTQDVSLQSSANLPGLPAWADRDWQIQTIPVVLRQAQDNLAGMDAVPASPEVFQFPLKGNTEFHTYTINLKKEIDDKDRLGRSKKEDTFSQIGILFPALPEGGDRQILIDYVHVLEYPVEPGILGSLLVQKDIPPLDEIEQRVEQKMRLKDPDLDVQYDDLSSEEEFLSDKPIKLVEISPRDPAPAVLRDGRFYLADTGKFSEDDSQDASLNYEERYVYTIELLDRKKQKSGEPVSLTVEYTRIPRAPYNLKAEPGDEEIRLTWNRPFLTVDGKKIRSFTGYNIFRSLKPGQYPDTPIYQASPYDTMFTDKALSNGVSYYYSIQAIVSTLADTYVGDFSQEVSAVPLDTIPPDVPTGLVGVYVEEKVNLFWNLTRAEDFSGFNLYRSEDPAGEFRQINSQPILQASYQDPTVEPNTTYYYYVISFDDAIPINVSRPSELAIVETFIIE